MDNFVESIVNQVIGSSGKNQRKPELQYGMQNFERPNYQKKAKDRRLMTFDLTDKNLGNTYEDNMSFENLTCAAMANMNEIEKTEYEEIQSSEPFSKNYTILESVDKRLARTMGYNCKEGDSVGIVTCNKNNAGQLFAADKILKEVKNIKFNMKCDKQNEENFIYECFGDEVLVRQAVSIMEDVINSNTKIYEIEKPSNLILQKLKIFDRPLVLVDRVSYISLMKYMNSYYKKYKESKIDFLYIENITVLQGDLKEGKKIAMDLLQNNYS